MELLAVVVWVLLAAMIGSAAFERGRGSIGWFFASLFFSPFLAWMFLMLLPMRYYVNWQDQHGNNCRGWLTERQVRERELNRWQLVDPNAP